MTVAIFAHPSGLNHPPYWHARDYGLFAVNPFGRKGYDPSAPERITRLAVGRAPERPIPSDGLLGQGRQGRLDRDFRELRAIVFIEDCDLH